MESIADYERADRNMFADAKPASSPEGHSIPFYLLSFTALLHFLSSRTEKTVDL